MTDIKKALQTKAYNDPREKLPSHYHEFLDVFDRKESDRLLLYRGFKVNYRIKLNPGTKAP